MKIFLGPYIHTYIYAYLWSVHNHTHVFNHTHIHKHSRPPVYHPYSVIPYLLVSAIFFPNPNCLHTSVLNTEKFAALPIKACNSFPWILTQQVIASSDIISHTPTPCKIPFLAFRSLGRVLPFPSSPFFIIIIIIIIIIIVSCHRHGYPWPSLATSPYRSSPLAGLQSYIPYPHIAAVCMFELVVLLLSGHMWGSIGVHHLWVRPCFSSSVLHVWFV